MLVRAVFLLYLVPLSNVLVYGKRVSLEGFFSGARIAGQTCSSVSSSGSHVLFNADVLFLLYNVDVLALLRNADVMILQNGSPLPEPNKRIRTQSFATKGAPPDG